MIDLFYQLRTAPLPKDKLKECISHADWFNRANFDLANLDDRILIHNLKLRKTVAKFKGIACIIKMNPMTWYNWHTDDKRKAAINFLIEGYDSKCFFGKQEDSNNFNLTELPYRPDRMYLFNVQRNHAILNLSETRYLLSIGFNCHSYDEILEYCLEQGV